MASSYSSIRADWRTTGPFQSSPRALRSESCVSSTPGRTRERSRSSTRTRNRAPAERANSQASSAVRRFPRWSGPVGLGAKRPSELKTLASLLPSFCRANSRNASQSLQPLCCSVCFLVERPQGGQERYRGSDQTNDKVGECESPDAVEIV